MTTAWEKTTNDLKRDFFRPFSSNKAVGESLYRLVQYNTCFCTFHLGSFIRSSTIFKHTRLTPVNRTINLGIYFLFKCFRPQTYNKEIAAFQFSVYCEIMAIGTSVFIITIIIALSVFKVFGYEDLHPLYFIRNCIM